MSPSLSRPSFSSQPVSSCVWTYQWLIPRIKKEKKPTTQNTLISKTIVIGDSHNGYLHLVSCTYDVDHHLPEGLSLFFGKVLEDVTVLFLEQLKAYCQVMVFQH